MGRDLFIFAMPSPAELRRPSKDPALTGNIPEEDDDDDDDETHVKGARLLNLRHPRVRLKSYPTRTSLTRYDLNLTLRCHRSYYLAPLPVLDPICLCADYCSSDLQLSVLS
jgi:hypothetical protein